MFEISSKMREKQILPRSFPKNLNNYFNKKYTHNKPVLTCNSESIAASTPKNHRYKKVKNNENNWSQINEGYQEFTNKPDWNITPKDNIINNNLQFPTSHSTPRSKFKYKNESFESSGSQFDSSSDAVKRFNRPFVRDWDEFLVDSTKQGVLKAINRQNLVKKANSVEKIQKIGKKRVNPKPKHISAFKRSILKDRRTRSLSARNRSYSIENTNYLNTFVSFIIYIYF